MNTYFRSRKRCLTGIRSLSFYINFVQEVCILFSLRTCLKVQPARQLGKKSLIQLSNYFSVGNTVSFSTYMSTCSQIITFKTAYLFHLFSNIFIEQTVSQIHANLQIINEITPNNKVMVEKGVLGDLINGSKQNNLATPQEANICLFLGKAFQKCIVMISSILTSISISN